MNSIFISYASEDRETAISISNSLKKNGFSSWIDVENLLPGQDWELEIEKAIRNSSIFIVCLSSNSVSKRGYVQSELKKALKVLDTIPDGEIFLIPVRLDPCEVPTRLTHLQWVDYYAKDGLERIVRAILRQAATAEADNQDNKTTVVSFANISIDSTDLNWVEIPKRLDHSPFTTECSQYFRLKEFVYNANLSLDVTILNVANSPIILTEVGIKILSVVQLMYIYGIPEAAKIYQIDSYTIEPPNIKERLKKSVSKDVLMGFSGRMEPYSIDEVVSVRVNDPVYLEAKAPYRYRLFINEYQRRLPNHLIMNLWAKTNMGDELSKPIELFTW